MPNMEELISRISRKISEGKEGECLETKLNFDYAYGADQIGRKYKNFMNLHRNRRRLYWILPFPERLLRTGRNTNNFSRTDRHDT